MLFVMTVSGFSVQVWDIMELIRARRLGTGRVAPLPVEDYTLKFADREAAELRPFPESEARMVSRHHVPAPQYLCMLVPDSHTLITTAIDGEMNIWHFHVVRPQRHKVEVTFYRKTTLKFHRAPIEDMKLLHDIGLIAAGSLDGTISLWGITGWPDGCGGRRGIGEDGMQQSFASAPGLAGEGFFLFKVLRGHFARGIRTLLYVTSCRFLVAAGWQRTMQTFDLFNGHATYGYPLIGHAAPVAALCALEHPKQRFRMIRKDEEEKQAYQNRFLGLFVSIDDTFQCRVWSVDRNLMCSPHDRCVQVFRAKPVTFGKSRDCPGGILNMITKPQEPVLGPTIISAITANLFHRTREKVPMIDAEEQDLLEEAIQSKHEVALLVLGRRWTAYEFLRRSTARVQSSSCAFVERSGCLVTCTNTATSVLSITTGRVELQDAGLPYTISYSTGVLSTDGKRMFGRYR